jgi:hypothetical protein
VDHRPLAFAAVVLLHGAASGAQASWTDAGRALRYQHRVTTVGNHMRVATHAVSVDLCDPGVELRVTAPEEGGRTVSAWARAVGAAVAVNGDYFDRATLRPLGPSRGAGRWWPDGRREHRDALLAAGAGLPVRILDAPDRATRDALWPDVRAQLEPALTEVVGVRERVLRDGMVSLNTRLPHDGHRHPRTGVGLSADGHTLFLLVVDGPGGESGGMTAGELAEALRALGARDGMKLDGGGSSTMYIASRGVVNRPSDGVERTVANHLGVRVRGEIAPGTRPWCGPHANHAARSWPAARSRMDEVALACALALGLAVTRRRHDCQHR